MVGAASGGGECGGSHGWLAAIALNDATELQVLQHDYPAVSFPERIAICGLDTGKRQEAPGNMERREFADETLVQAIALGQAEIGKRLVEAGVELVGHLIPVSPQEGIESRFVVVRRFFHIQVARCRFLSWQRLFSMRTSAIEAIAEVAAHSSPDPDEAPEWDAEAFARAELREGDRLLRPADGTLTRRGRARAENPKQLVSLRVDREALERLRAMGPGWQTRVNAVLRGIVGLWGLP